MEPEAKRTLIKYSRKLRSAKKRAREGDQQAATELVRLLAQRNEELAKLGYVHNGKDEPDGQWIKQAAKFVFEVEFAGEPGAGLNPFSETVTVTVANDPGGQAGEFKEFIKDALREWFDGATVYDEEEMDAYVAQQERLVEGD